MGAPKGDNFEELTAWPVVDVVPDALEQPAASLGILGVLDLGPDAREIDQDLQGLFQV